MNPDVRVKVWGNDDVERFIAKIYPKYLDLYHFLKLDIQRADLARLLILYKIGGVYADLDYECLKPIDFWDENRMVVSQEPEEHANHWISNAFFASPRKHPYLIKIARHGREKVKSDDRNIHGSFGAIAFAEVIRYEESLIEDPTMAKVYYLNSALVFPFPDISRDPLLHATYKDMITKRDFGEAIGAHYWDHSYLVTWAILDIYPQPEMLDIAAIEEETPTTNQSCGCGTKTVTFNPVVQFFDPQQEKTQANA